MIVVDAGLLVWLLCDKGRIGRAARDRVRGERLLAPHLVDVEVTSALLGRHRGGKLTDTERDEAFAALAMLPVRRFKHLPLVPRARELSANLSPYDAMYVALAEGFGVPLLTSDGRIKDGAASVGAKCEVEVLNERTVPNDGS
ncbi:ribonuclease VapC12 [Streptomyces spiroverticillatus]|uniref:Ribonuclease VapC n=1 Tax=Streptomyces finlayi TaxID=67296 RepID=A0A919C6R6_9ACTN|nr:type II toxin-antitoxin system VapC family toxin [Streptomyces finlayi]GGZ87756.1 ribonuclease VapC12 [Streptomyces spiroverticillatus]GHC78921.1 ribonuclease VapC12 [Streptomyces finlayi]